ncbi:MAG: rod shape-determining protein MreC [Deltaproteobacteria bacterium]|nr:rod shape-determining protein MreC [Deltaproteobacteria bacterium]
MGSFLRRWWRIFIALALLVAAIQVFVRPSAALEKAEPVRNVGAAFFRPVFLGIDFLRQGVFGIWDHYIALVGTTKENERLREEVAELQEKLNTVRDAQLENRRLKELLQYSGTLERRTVGARVVGHDVTPWFQAVFLGTGTEAGIEQGMSVVTPQGAVGRIHSARSGVSEVLLVTDGRFAADVMVERNRVRAVAEGIGGNFCRLKYVSPVYDVAVGDRIVFSGFDGAMPKGMLLGTVASVDRPKESLFQKVKVQCAVNFQDVEDVLVILSRPTIPFRSGKE